MMVVHHDDIESILPEMLAFSQARRGYRQYVRDPPSHSTLGSSFQPLRGLEAFYEDNPSKNILVVSVERPRPSDFVSPAVLSGGPV